MLKRRLVVLGATAVLALGGLAGSAMADETPAPAAGAKVTCTTSDGNTVHLAKALPVKIEDVESATTDGKKAERSAPNADDAGAVIRALPEGETLHVTKAEPGSPDEALEWSPAIPAEPGKTALPAEPGKTALPAEPGKAAVLGDGTAPPEAAKTVKIICKKAE
ncbi:hypothetical protein GCM10022224_101720 [Nonomuraea antimicrobica]|uniref:Uncharacterized protein n=1 Tax=Nonomuraea antimicrobica TaxID=561173 RepID=A0ABP7EJJ0_9ACTN